MKPNLYDVTILLVCPVIIIYGGIKALRHPREVPLEIPSPTRGMPLDWLAPFYDRYCSRVGLGPRFREETLRHAALRAGERVLDVGCGTGVLTRLAARTVGSEGRVVDIARPANPLWWVFIWPLLFWSFTKDQVRGRLDSYFRRVGFSRIETLGHWRGLLTFYLAYKV